MPAELDKLLEKAKSVTMTPVQREAQRRSFVYGNTKIENPRITRASVDRAAESLASDNGKRNNR